MSANTTSSDPGIRFSVDVTEVIESLKNSGYATTNADVALIGASLAYKFGNQTFSGNTQTYVRIGVLSRQTNFENFALALILANKAKNEEKIDANFSSLEANISYFSNMANSGLIYLKKLMRDFGREASEVLPELMHEALGTRPPTLSSEELTTIGNEIVFNQDEEEE